MMSSISSSSSVIRPKQQQHQEMFQEIYQNSSNINMNKTQVDHNVKPSRMSISHAKGLLNMPGQNNCFLNSAVQVLWHLDIFRRSFRELSGHACMADSCIFCALKELFNQFQYSQESALPPDALRFALAEAFSDQRRFQLGFMDDAAECFENILLRIHCHIANQDSEEMCNVTHCLQHCIPHQKFAMNLIEQIICHSCGATSEPFPFTQMVHYVSTPALCAQAKQYDYEIGMTFGELLKSAGAVGDIRDCPNSCGARIQIKKSLINKPDIVSIGLVWDSERPTINHIMDVFRAIGTTLRLPDVFDTVSECRGAVSTVLQLVGLVTYYGKHYSTFFFHTKLREWIYFDDAAVRAIGPHWEQVVDKCIRGHFQPLLLLYANPNGTPVNTENAPKEVTPLVVNKNNRRSYLSPLQPKCDTTSNNYQLIQNIPRNISTHISSDTESNIRSVLPPIDKRNLTNIVKHLNGQNLLNKHYSSQQQTNWNYNNSGLVKPLLSTLATNPKAKLNQIRTNQNYVPQKIGSMDTLLKSGSQSASSDVPDSPSARSTTSYFSDVGELDNGYISRKTVESILNLQRHSLKKKAGNRNSSSSLESFDIRNGALVSSKNQLPNERSLVCSLQRHDSGNSSGDRHSNSSASVSSVESPYYTYVVGNRRPFSNLPGHRHPPSPKLSSDQGYDSFSLSSTDSYPSVGGSSSPGKLNPRLKQIPEDVQLMELINASTMLDCDKLCSEADVLLLKSHEKEREGDLRAAAALSDSAASKARSAMDAPYSNHQTLITAKMKHSMCVMRSASLHKRVKEMEAEEKRRLKAEQLTASTNSTIEYHHSRQSSRDSTHSKHSRQGSKDSKDGKNKEFNTKHASLEFNKSRINEGSIAAGKTLELYATLPKKGSKKKILQQSLSSLASLRIKSDDSNLYKDIICRRDSVSTVLTDNSQVVPKKKVENNKKTVDIKKIVPNNSVKVSTNNVKQVKSDHSLKYSSRESDFSDYYSEWEATRRSQQPLQRTLSGSASCRENDSEFYAEVGAFAGQSTVKKQHKVRRKLLMGGFMKRKNKSLPDLREGLKSSSNECQTENSQIELTQEESLNGNQTVAQVSSKGFHQPHRAFISERGLYQRPSLLKVSPPLIEKPNPGNQSSHPNNLKLSTNMKSPSTHSTGSTFSQNEHLPRPPTPPKAKTTAPIVPMIEVDSNLNANKQMESSFLKELASKRAEIMNSSNKVKPTESVTISSKEPIINSIPSNSNLNMKSMLKTSIPKHNQNINNNNNNNYDSLHFNSKNSNSMISQIASSIPKSLSSQTSSVSTSPKSGFADKTNDSNTGINSVKDLASKFEKIMNKQEDKQTNEILNETLETNDQKKTNLPSNSSHRMVVLLGTNKKEEIITPKQIMPTVLMNKPDDHSVQSKIPSPINSSIPIKSNCLSPAMRPNRPPDYQTAMKRIGMLRNDRPVLNIQQTRPFYMNASGNIVQPNSPRSPQPQALQIQPQLNESPKCVALSLSSEQSMQQLLNTSQANFDEQNSPTRRKNGFKKSVSFSDQVVLVACAEEEEEEYLPNPILERILGKNNSNNSQQSM